MIDNYLRRLRWKAKRFGMTIRRNRDEQGGFLLIRLEDGFDVFGGPVDLDDIEARIRREAEA